MGDMSLLSPLAIAFVLILLYCYTKCFQVNIPKLYSKSEKDGALNAFAVALLLIRDKRLKQLQNKEKVSNDDKSLLSIIVDELSAHADVTSNHYATKVKSKKGVNWSYLTGRAKSRIKHPLRISIATRRKTWAQVHIHDTVNPLVSRVGNVHQRGSGLGEDDVEMTDFRKVDTTDADVLAAAAKVFGVTPCELALAEDPELIILNRPASDLEVLPLDADQSSLDRAISIANGYITKLKALQCAMDDKNSSEYWALSSKISQLGRLNVHFGDADAELCQKYYQKLTELALLHTSLFMKCSPDFALENYGGRVAYFVHNEVILLRDLHHRAYRGLEVL